MPDFNPAYLQDKPMTCLHSPGGYCANCPQHRCAIHATGHYDPFPASGDLVPGYADTADGRADARDQARMDAR